MTYTIDLDDGFDSRLSLLAEQRQTSKAELIRRALATYYCLSELANEKTGHKVSITDADDRVLKDVEIP